MDVEFSTNADFWLYCVTQTAEARLFVDFNAHACVLIKDRAEFTRRLREATRGQLMGAEMREANAVYGETLNGVQIRDKHQFQFPVDPYREEGQPDRGLLPNIAAALTEPEGSTRCPRP